MSDQPGDHLPDEQLHLLLDGELGPVAERLEAHLSHCGHCARRLERLQVLFRRIESMPEVDFEGDLAGAVLAELPIPRRRLPRLAALEAALAVALLAAIGPWLAAAGWAEGFSRSLQAWVGSLEQALALQLPGLSTPLLELLQLPESIGGPSLPLGLPSIPAAQLWLLAGSAVALWAVGNGLLLRRSAIRGKERR